MSDAYLAAALLGFAGGIAAVVLCAALFVGYRRLSNPAHAAGIRRALKFLAFQVGGLVLANAAYFAALALIHTSLDPATVQVLGAGLGSMAAGVQKTHSWQTVAAEYHVETVALEIPTAARSMVAPQDPALPAG
jgi:hypothetical protein